MPEPADATVPAWADVAREPFQRTATPRYVAYAVPWCVHGLSADARSRLRAAVGSPAMLLEPLLRPAFLRLERAAFRHLPS